MENKEEKIKFLRGRSLEETETAKKLLINANIKFTELFSSSFRSPVLIRSNTAQPYNGLASIRTYCKTHQNISFEKEPETSC
jgi:hypothetical protein